MNLSRFHALMTSRDEILAITLMFNIFLHQIREVVSVQKKQCIPMLPRSLKSTIKKQKQIKCDFQHRYPHILMKCILLALPW